MTLTDDKYMLLAELYLQAGLGKRINGLIHNLNNYVHVVDMQLAMLVKKADSSGHEPLENFKDKIVRSAAGNLKIVESLQKNSQCAFFAQKSQTQINIKEYLNWLVEFWNNDLFFKHKISCRLVFVETQNINIQLPPFHLTLCLEQGISNAVEACQAISINDEHELVLEAVSEGKGVNLMLVSNTQVDDLDPWVPGSSSKSGHLGMGLPLCAYLAKRMGWKIELHSSGNQTTFMIAIPELRSTDAG